MLKAMKQTASGVIETLPPGFNISPTLHTFCHKYLLCGDLVTLWHNLRYLQGIPARYHASKVRDRTNRKHCCMTEWFSHHLCFFLSPHYILYWFIITFYNLPAKKNNSKIIKLYWGFLIVSQTFCSILYTLIIAMTQKLYLPSRIHKCFQRAPEYRAPTIIQSMHRMTRLNGMDKYCDSKAMWCTDGVTSSSWPALSPFIPPGANIRSRHINEVKTNMW